MNSDVKTVNALKRVHGSAMVPMTAAMGQTRRAVVGALTQTS